MNKNMIFEEVRQGIAMLTGEFYKMGVMHIGVLVHIINYENDAEIYIVPDESTGYNYFGVENLLNKTFQNYKIGIYDDKSREELGETIISCIQFC